MVKKATSKKKIPTITLNHLTTLTKKDFLALVGENFDKLKEFHKSSKQVNMISKHMGAPTAANIK